MWSAPARSLIHFNDKCLSLTRLLNHCTCRRSEQSHFQADGSVLGSFIYITEVFCTEMCCWTFGTSTSLCSVCRKSMLAVFSADLRAFSAFWLVYLSGCRYHHLVLLLRIPAYFANFFHILASYRPLLFHVMIAACILLRIPFPFTIKECFEG